MSPCCPAGAPGTAPRRMTMSTAVKIASCRQTPWEQSEGRNAAGESSAAGRSDQFSVPHPRADTPALCNPKQRGGGEREQNALGRRDGSPARPWGWARRGSKSQPAARALLLPPLPHPVLLPWPSASTPLPAAGADTYRRNGNLSGSPMGSREEGLEGSRAGWVAVRSREGWGEKKQTWLQSRGGSEAARLWVLKVFISGARKQTLLSFTVWWDSILAVGCAGCTGRARESVMGTTHLCRAGVNRQPGVVTPGHPQPLTGNFLYQGIMPRWKGLKQSVFNSFILYWVYHPE